MKEIFKQEGAADIASSGESTAPDVKAANRPRASVGEAAQLVGQQGRERGPMRQNITLIVISAFLVGCGVESHAAGRQASAAASRRLCRWLGQWAEQCTDNSGVNKHDDKECCVADPA